MFSWRGRAGALPRLRLLLALYTKPPLLANSHQGTIFAENRAHFRHIAQTYPCFFPNIYTRRHHFVLLCNRIVNFRSLFRYYSQILPGIHPSKRTKRGKPLAGQGVSRCATFFSALKNPETWARGGPEMPPFPPVCRGWQRPDPADPSPARPRFSGRCPGWS